MLLCSIFFFVVSFLGLDLVDSVDTLLECGFRAFMFHLFRLTMLLALVATSLFVVTSICEVLKNPIETNV